MRKLWAGLLIVLVVVTAVTAAGAKTKAPPLADENAQVACESIREIDVLGASDSTVSLMIRALEESRSSGAAKLGDRLFAAPSPAAQSAVISQVARWCSSTLQLQCSAVKCIGGRQVVSIPKRS